MNYIKISRYLSYLLRHNPDGLHMDKDGYCDINKVIEKIKGRYKEFNRENLMVIVKEDDKGRYSYSVDGYKIRANQGHSITTLDFERVNPPDSLYHGTATKYMSSIKKQGLTKQGRHHVHLSDNRSMAKSVGSRHGDVIILEVDSKSMSEDGFEFYLSSNGVYLTDHVLTKYISW